MKPIRQRWRVLGIESIKYPQDNDADYSKLHEGVRRLAEEFGRGVLDWQRDITELARKKPPLLGEEEAGLIEEALKDETRTRFFTDAASSPEWIDWLDQRKHLDALFGSDTLSKQDKMLAQLLAERFAFRYANALFLLIARHHMRLHPFFWQVLGRKIGLGEQHPLHKEVLSRWISLLLATAPPCSHTWVFRLCCFGWGRNPLRMECWRACYKYSMRWRKAVCCSNGTFGGKVFTMTGTTTPVDVDLPLIGEQYHLEVLWRNGLKPNLAQVAEPLLRRLIGSLEERHLTLCTWRRSKQRSWDSESLRRSAIEPHEQDQYPEAVDVLIDSARDCLEWLAANQASSSALWCDRLVVSQAQLLRRLAVHTLSARADLTADDKIAWLLERIDLHDLPAQHEIFRAVRLAYPEASPERRKTIIDAVRAYRWPDEEDPHKERRTAYHQFEWLHWLYSADSNCVLAKQALDAVSAQHPEFKPSEGPDFIIWSGGEAEIVRPQSPWTIKELLAKPAADWLRELVSFQPTEFLGPSRDGLVNAVQEAVEQKFDWGLGLADALAKAGEWNSDLWSGLIRAWSGMDLDEAKHRELLNRLGKVELYRKHEREIADALNALVKDQGTSYALNLLPQANEIAASLWRHLDRAAQPKETDSWLTKAINHPAGVLAEFWLQGLSLWRKHQEPLPKVMSDESRTALSGIVQDPTLPGRLGRSVLAGQVAFLLAADEEWTKEKLIPLFGDRRNINDFQAVWDGFLTWGRLNSTVAEHLKNAFLEAVQQIDGDLASRRNDFVKYYTTMTWVLCCRPTRSMGSQNFSAMGVSEARRRFAFEVGGHLRRMEEAKQREWWGRWLKQPLGESLAGRTGSP